MNWMSSVFFKVCLFGFIGLACPTALLKAEGIIKGTVLDKNSGEPVIGAAVMLEQTLKGAATDLDGSFSISGIPAGKYNLHVSCLSYTTLQVEGVEITDDRTVELKIVLEAATEALEEVTVRAVRKMNSEVAMVNAVKASPVVMSAVSSQLITKSQDRDASEVVKRIPGISIIDDKFVIARGLSQRYNNVWINNSAVPSSEADSRAFSFDIVPSAQIENIMIMKSPSPEIPADFTGGFIKISTKDTPEKNQYMLSYGVSVNDRTHFRNFKYNKGSATDWLGFDNGMRMVKGGIKGVFDNEDAASVEEMTKQGFNNDWKVRHKKPFPDQRFSFMFGQVFKGGEDRKLALTGALNYSNTGKSYIGMENSRFGVYNKVKDEPIYQYKYTDNQYTRNARLGAMLNLAFTGSKSRFYFRNIFNQLGSNRYTERRGWQNISSLYIQEKAEYIYGSRSTYCGQFSGVHDLPAGTLDWNLGYSYANKNQPDRRIIERQQNDIVGDVNYGKMRIDQNDIYRDFLRLDEHIVSFGANYNYLFNESGGFTPTLKAGVYGEYCKRDYKNRAYYYRFYEDHMPAGFAYEPVVENILQAENFGADKLYLYDDTDNKNSYKGNNLLYAAYLALNIPWQRFNVYAGVRLENRNMTLTNYISSNAWISKDTDFDNTDFFPSVNVSYNLTDKQLIRFAYGKSVNRQEFREVSSSVYEDFELFSDVKGNPDLKPAYIHNLDLRYEWYPASGESVSVALFYKHFRHPIEWTFRDGGGSYTYTFENADKARNYGVEVDIRKDLEFIGLRNFMLNLNGSWIKSKVSFDSENSLEHDRPMQGQSPYLVNAGLFYQTEKAGVMAGVLYNRIGKRIVGIGRSDMSVGGSINNDIPDMYEMPHDALDIVLSKKFGKQVEVKLNAKDVIGQDAVFKQFPRFEDANGQIVEREQTTKRFAPGRSFTLSVSIHL